MKVSHQILSFILIAPLCLWGCRASKEMTNTQSQNSILVRKDSSSVNYTLIYIIHGDASYLYHDEEGHEKQSDEQAVEKAKSISRRAKHGEVFIFHQKPEKKILGLFPKKDRRFLHYRKGKLEHDQKYSPASSTRSFVAEHQLYEKYVTNPSGKKIFLYYGHEIPQPDDEITYSGSRPEAIFNTDTFTDGVHAFLQSNDAFDLTVLSTCDNGTPIMVSKLDSYTKYLLASPQNLHLSQIDSEPLLRLENNLQIPTIELAQSIAKETFNRLRDFIQTAITLSIYNMPDVSHFAEMMAQSYKDYRKKNSTNDFNIDNTDCATLPFWNSTQVLKDVDKYYKPARFGQRKTQKYYSGWGCRE